MYIVPEKWECFLKGFLFVYLNCCYASHFERIWSEGNTLRMNMPRIELWLSLGGGSLWLPADGVFSLTLWLGQVSDMSVRVSIQCSLGHNYNYNNDNESNQLQYRKFCWIPLSTLYTVGQLNWSEGVLWKMKNMFD